MQVAIVGDSNSGPLVVRDLLARLGYITNFQADPTHRASPEIMELFKINCDLLGQLGGSTAPPPRLPDGWEARGGLDAFYIRAHNAIERLDLQARDWAWHDPATNITAPFWQRVLPQMRFAVCVRNPHEVVAQTSAKSPIERSFAYAKWHWTYLNLLSVTNPDNRFTVVYDQLISSPEHVLQVAGFFSPSRQLRSELQSIVQTSELNRQSSIDALECDTDIHDAARRLYIGMQSESEHDEIERQLAARDALLSVLFPILERADAY